MKREKQTTIVLNWLKTHKELTTRDAVIELNIMSLPKRIEELRHSGYTIKTTYRVTNNGRRYGVYTLEEGPNE